MADPALAPRFEPDVGWVPADKRLFGVDRRTIVPTLVVFALVIMMSVVLPVVNATGALRRHCQGRRCYGAPMRCDIRPGGGLGYQVRCPRR